MLVLLIFLVFFSEVFMTFNMKERNRLIACGVLWNDLF